MSASIQTTIETARARCNWSALDRLLDDQRQAFLDRLHAALNHCRRRGNESLNSPPRIRLTAWEAQFVQDFVLSPRGFDDVQRDAIDELRHRFQHRL